MPFLSFSSASVTSFVSQTPKPKRHQHSNSIDEDLRGQRFSGVLTKKGASQIKRLISTWDFCNEEAKKAKRETKFASGKPWAFVTLTLPAPQRHSHKEIKRKCLNTFLITLARKFAGVRYFWKAELQKNENIHFHLLVDRFIAYQVIRKMWNDSISSLGYIQDYSTRAKARYQNNFDLYYKETKHKDRKSAEKAFHFGEPFFMQLTSKLHFSIFSN